MSMCPSEGMCSNSHPLERLIDSNVVELYFELKQTLNEGEHVVIV